MDAFLSVIGATTVALVSSVAGYSYWSLKALPGLLVKDLEDDTALHVADLDNNRKSRLALSAESKVHKALILADFSSSLDSWKRGRRISAGVFVVVLAGSSIWSMWVALLSIGAFVASKTLGIDGRAGALERVLIRSLVARIEDWDQEFPGDCREFCRSARFRAFKNIYDIVHIEDLVLDDDK